MTDLNARLLAAHVAGDQTTLVDLYTEAADQADTIDATCFFLTHAYVFALEMGHAKTAALHARLALHNRI